MYSEHLIVALGLSIILDLLIGDPRGMPHPVRWMGKAIECLEPSFRSLLWELRWTGALMVIFLVAGVWLISVVIIHVAGAAHPLAGTLIQAVMIFTCISARSLIDAALEVGSALKQSGLAAGRHAVAMIVGREVDQLDETGVTRAAVETVAENLVDGVISPIFFAVIGGAPLAMAYKMVNTLDSMIGYKNEQYRDFGWFAAHLDDVANFIPARLSVPFIALAAHLLGGRGKAALNGAVADGRSHASPNAGYPEAAFAGALNIWMGGANFYHGQRVEKPVIGRRGSDARQEHIEKACQLMLATALIFFLAASVTILILH